MAEYDRSTNTVTMSVRDITDFIFRDGNAASESYSVPEEKMLAGARFHRSYEQKLENKGYTPEYRTEYLHEYPDGLKLKIQGIADAVKDTKKKLYVCEIKTVSVDVQSLETESIPKYRAQVYMYAYMIMCEKNAKACNISIVYHNISKSATKILDEVESFENAENFFKDVLGRLHPWLLLYLDHTKVRDAGLKALAFPHESYRKGQRDICAAVFRAVRDGTKLFVEAPTGTGKTISALFPSLKAMGEGYCGKIFYLTAKVITRSVAKEALESLTSSGLSLRSIILTAKSKSCLGGGNCLPHLCKYSDGHGERVNSAIFAMVSENSLITPETVADYAERYTVCPHELALDASMFCDVIVGDYNHAYDPNATLQRYFSSPSDFAVLVDEVHNLPDRARDMYSSELEASELRAAAKALKDAPKKVKSTFSKLAREISAIGKSLDEENIDDIKHTVSLTEGFIGALDALCEEYRRFLSKDDYDKEKELTIDVYFKCRFFHTLTECRDIYENSFSVYFDRTARKKRLCIMCTDPSPILEELAELPKSTVLFSATLRPFGYYFDVLGGKAERDKYISVGSPFPSENLLCASLCGISTVYKDRSTSYTAICDAICEAVKHKVGNYLVFFPSFKYMDDVYEVFTESFSHGKSLDVIRQTPDMTDGERSDFLMRFNEYGSSTLIGFTVCGGVFSEGVDLKGERLSGAIVVGTGMPAICFERDLLKKSYGSKGRDGFDFAYTYPGLNRVFQAGGRVIRSETDRGFVLLIDTRYRSRKYLSCLPDSWRGIRFFKDISGLSDILREFWNK